MDKKKGINAYLNLPIRFKILFWFIPLLLLTIAVTGGYSYYTAKNQVFKKTQLAQEDITVQISNQLDSISNNAVDFTHYLFLLSSVQHFLNPITEEDSISRRKQINEIVSSLLINERDIQSLVLYSFNEGVPSLAVNQTGITSAIPFEEFQQTKSYQLAIEQDSKSSWTLLKEEERLFQGDGNTKLLLTRVIKNSYTLEKIGIVIVGINEKILREKFTEGLSNDAQMFILGRDDQVFTSTNTSWVGSKLVDTPFFNQDSNGTLMLTDHNYLSAESISENGWKVVLLQPRKKLLNELNNIKVLTFLVAALCFLLGGLFSWYVSSFITKPLKKLSTSMTKLQKGDFNQQVDFHGNDEVGMLGKGYNMMVTQMKRLIDDVYRSKLGEKEAELKLLQAQIHPHFLYNTLDTIFWMAQRKKETAIADMVHSLSQFFRLSLSDGKDFVPVLHEVLLVENYLNLQKNRFTNKFTYEVNISDDVKNLLIPKLIIQPLIENSLIHGIEALEDSGFIYIHIYQENNELLINVVDNGFGMEEVKYQKINAYLESYHWKEEGTITKRERPGYALLNIMDRLKIIYGKESNLAIESKLGFGTKIKISIPLSSNHTSY